MTNATGQNDAAIDNHALDTDVAIIGAGPVGLFAVFELGLLDLNCVLIDVLDKPGGQCAELYPDKPIYDIPALPVITGADLTTQLMTQIKPFAPRFCLDHTVTSMIQAEDGQYIVHTDRGTTIHARAVVIATGGGLFTPKKLPLENATAYETKSLYYAVRNRTALKDQHIVIAGGGDSALDWALDLIGYAASVTLTHRRDEFRAAPAQVSKMRTAVADGQMNLVIGTPSALHGANDQISHIDIMRADGVAQSLACDRLLVFYGLTMTEGPLAKMGLPLQNGLVPVDTACFATPLQGVYAIGDACTYPGKLKLILSGFHEGALAAQAIFKYIHPDRKWRFLYTTASSDLHKKLGVSGT